MPHRQAAPPPMAPPGLTPHPCPRMRHLNSIIHKAPSLSQAAQTRMGQHNPASNQKLTLGTAPCSLEDGTLHSSTELAADTGNGPCSLELHSDHDVVCCCWLESTVLLQMFMCTVSSIALPPSMCCFSAVGWSGSWQSVYTLAPPV